MKNIIIWIFGICIIALASCEDVIELDLENADSRIIIEANLNATDRSIEVLVSESNGFYEASGRINAENAQVELLKDNGERILLEEDDTGVHRATNIELNSQDKFNLEVSVADQTYTASSIVPSSATLNQLDTSSFNAPFGPTAGEEVAMLISSWDDDPGLDNYYRLRTYTSEVYNPGTYNVFTDLGFEGSTMRRSIPVSYASGDRVRLELLSTDRAYYEFYQALDAIQGDGGNSVPFNPKGNFTNDALGYFGIYYESSLEIQL